MTISKRIGVSYILIVAVSVVIIVWFGYHEFVEERAEFDALGYTELHKELGPEILTVCFFGAMPLILGLGWWWIHHVLSPLRVLTAAVEKVGEHNLRTPLPRTLNDDEVDKLSAVFNSMTTRLDESFQRIHEFTLHASHELKTPLTVISHRMRQLLLILTDNAVKYNRPGGPVSISLRGENASGKVEGCGLGLAIAQWIVQSKGGTIELRSEPDGKTTVVVRLPVSHPARFPVAENAAAVRLPATEEPAHQW